MSHLPHTQPSQYKDGKKIIQVIRGLYSEGKLNEQQSLPFSHRRPPEELYDLQSDPHEMVNLAMDSKHRERLVSMRKVLHQRMMATRDMGLIPEPILEDMGKKAGNKYSAFVRNDHRKQTQDLIDVITAGEANDSDKLLHFAKSADPSTRYWAAVWLGVNKTAESKATLLKLTNDPVPAVRVAAAQPGEELRCHRGAAVLVPETNERGVSSEEGASGKGERRFRHVSAGLATGALTDAESLFRFGSVGVGRNARDAVVLTLLEKKDFTRQDSASPNE